MKTVFSSLLAVLVVSTSGAFANPNQAPGIDEQLKKYFGRDVEISKIELSNEDLRREGNQAHYYSEFVAHLGWNMPFFDAVDIQDDYVIIQEVFGIEDTLPVYGNALGFYQSGEWSVELNVKDVHSHGGKPMSAFISDGRVVFIAGTGDADEFVRLRKEALAVAHEIELERIKLQSERAEVELIAAERIQAALIHRQGQAKEALQSVFSEGTTFDGEISHRGRRVRTVFSIETTYSNHAEGVFSAELGNEQFYEAPFIIRTHRNPGEAVLEYSELKDFRHGGMSSASCRASGAFNLESNSLLLTYDGLNVAQCGAEFHMMGFQDS